MSIGQNTQAGDPVAAALDKIRERAKAATPGPWRNEPNTGAGRVWVQISRHRGDRDCEPLFNVRSPGRNPSTEEYQQRAADAGFIAHARTDVPRLLAVVDALLGLADDWTRQSADLDEMAERAECRGADPLRTTLMSARAQARQDSAGELRATVSHVLAREVT